MKFDHANGCGQMSGESVCWLVMSEVARMNTNGNRNATDSAIATEWLATDMRIRRRRIEGGTGRREIVVAVPRAETAVT